MHATAAFIQRGGPGMVAKHQSSVGRTTKLRLQMVTASIQLVSQILLMNVRISESERAAKSASCAQCLRPLAALLKFSHFQLWRLRNSLLERLALGTLRQHDNDRIKRSTGTV